MHSRLHLNEQEPDLSGVLAVAVWKREGIGKIQQNVLTINYPGFIFTATS